MPIFNSYYSGPALEGINRGRTADAAVDASDSASQRSYLASLAADRSRNQLGNRELDVRQALGGAEIAQKGDLGREDLSLRRFLGSGALENTKDANATTRELGLGQLETQAGIAKLNAETELKRIQGQLDQVRLQGDQMIKYAQAGGGLNPQMQRDLLHNHQQQAELQAQAESAAQIANADLDTIIKGLDQPWTWDTDASRRTYFNTDPEARAGAIGSVLKTQGQNAGLISFDPSTRQFTPSRTLFPSGMMVAPGTNTVSGSTVLPPRPLSLWQRFKAGQ